MKNMLKVGLTGGIGTGKTAVSAHFRSLGVPVIDADELARSVVAVGSEGLNAVATVFGNDIINPDGNINRSALRKIVFSNPEKKRQLEDILHPRIRLEIQNQLNQIDAAYVILSIPLLTENHKHYHLDRILVVDVPVELQIMRAAERDNQSPEEIQDIINAQAPRESRLAMADDVIDNTGNIEELKTYVSQLHKKYMKLAKLF